MPSTTAARFVGWHRPTPRSPWQAIVTADSEADAFGKLLDTVPGGDKVVLPAGTDPNDRPATKGHRR